GGPQSSKVRVNGFPRATGGDTVWSVNSPSPSAPVIPAGGALTLTSYAVRYASGASGRKTMVVGSLQVMPPGTAGTIRNDCCVASVFTGIENRSVRTASIGT